MLDVRQGLHDPTFLSKEQLDLEKLVACVVVPFLGSRGLYEGGPEPVTKANYRPTLPHLPMSKPKITITGGLPLHLWGVINCPWSFRQGGVWSLEEICGCFRDS